MVDDEPGKKRTGRQNKSPPKTSPTKRAEGSESPDDNCVCGKYMPAEVSIGCETCEVYWHLSCVGLKGLTVEMVKVLEHWECPKCLYAHW